MNRERLGDLILFLDNLLADGFVLIVGIIFFAAFFTNKEAVVRVNEYGEAGVEAIMIPIVFAVAVAGTLIRLKRGYDES
jgi:hypothetical protein